jgi:hypothetical protein
MNGHSAGERPVELLDHETKYALPAAMAGPARQLLAGTCLREEPHARSRVETIYFDDRELSSAAEKLASDYLKTKVRLRWYDGAGPVLLEVKRRFGTRREKTRIPCPVDGTELSRGGLAAAALCGVREELLRRGFEPPADLAPALRLSYDRDRFVDPATGVRLSLDTAIVARERARWCGPGIGIAGAESPVAIVECKGGSRELPPAVAALASLGARRGSFSKYLVCLQHGFD